MSEKKIYTSVIEHGEKIILMRVTNVVFLWWNLCRIPVLRLRSIPTPPSTINLCPHTQMQFMLVVSKHSFLCSNYNCLARPGEWGVCVEYFQGGTFPYPVWHMPRNAVIYALSPTVQESTDQSSDVISQYAPPGGSIIIVVL